MAMGTLRQEGQQEVWVATKDVVESPRNVFYDRLNEIPGKRIGSTTKGGSAAGVFIRRGEYGRPSMAPGVYFRALLIGYFEGLDSERGIRLEGC